MKRVFDLVIATAAVIVLSPVLVAVAAAVRLRLGAPVLFRQQRAGLSGRPFVLLKFRTMTDACDVDGSPLPDSVRLTPLGRRLRRTSLDELPELWNILRGDMSLVGPRPLPTAYLSRYTQAESRRHEARPGLTGWAQVHGRNAVGWDRRLALDVWYIDNRSLTLDARILAQTASLVLRRTGISAEGTETMGELRPHLVSAYEQRSDR